MADLDFERNRLFEDDANFLKDDPDKPKRCKILVYAVRQAFKKQAKENKQSTTKERGAAWEQIVDIAADLECSLESGGKTPNDQLTRALTDIQRGKKQYALVVILAWLCSYDGDWAQWAYHETGLAKHCGLPVRQYVGKPGEWHLAREGKEAAKRRLAAHGVPDRITAQGLIPTPSSSSMPKLRPPTGSQSPPHYGNSDVAFVGRQAELATLAAFADISPGFRWMQIAGSDGQGKRRLATQFAQQLSQPWRAGLLCGIDLQNFSEQVHSWTPQNPHLVILDSIAANLTMVGEILQTLALRNDEMNAAVRVVLVERHRWDVSAGDGRVSTLSNRAAWLEDLHVLHDGPDLSSPLFAGEGNITVLSGLPIEDLYSIFLDACPNKRMADIFDLERFSETMDRLGMAGAPQAAVILGKIIVDSFTTWNWPIGDYLSELLGQRRLRYWIQELDKRNLTINTDHPSLRVAILVNIVGHLSSKDIDNIEEVGLVSLDEALLRQVHTLTDSPISSGALGQDRNIHSLESPLFCAFFVLNSVDRTNLARILMPVAWDIASGKTADFLRLCVQEFSGHGGLLKLLAIPIPVSVPTKFVTNLYVDTLAGLHTKPVPPCMFNQLTEAALNGNGNAALALAKYYERLHGFPMDDACEYFWNLRAAAGGSLEAKFWLGARFYLGDHYDDDSGIFSGVDYARAALWLSQAASDECPKAKNLLGLCYTLERGVELDLAAAFALFADAARVGYTPAMHNYAEFLEKGAGTKQEQAEVPNLRSRVRDIEKRTGPHIPRYYLHLTK